MVPSERFWRRMQSPPVLRGRWEFLLLIGLALLWFMVFRLRMGWTTHPCMTTPSLCSPETVNAMDRFAIGRVNYGFNTASFITQDGAGLLALLLPTLLHGYRAFKGMIPWLKGVQMAAVDFLLVLQATLLNGVVNEIVRFWVRRPRPFVYADPEFQAANAAHYSSFYSGHTSFAALSTLSLVLILLGRGVERSRAVVLLIAVSLPLTAATGVLRVVSGRHFWTDVAAGAVAGFAIAFFVQWTHRRPR